MDNTNLIQETAEYQVVLVLPDSRKVMTLHGSDGYRLPRFRIPLWQRPAEWLQRVIRIELGVHVVIVDFVASTDDAKCAVAEILDGNATEHLFVEVSEISQLDITAHQRIHIASVVAGQTTDPLTQIGWIETAIKWLESTTGQRFFKREIEQYNAGNGFALLRFRSVDDCHFWLKATRAPNEHEWSVTRALSALGGDSLPEIIASRSDWNAWLMAETARPISDSRGNSNIPHALMQSAVASLGRLQLTTAGRTSALLEAGAFDQRLTLFRECSQEVFEYLDEAMRKQTSTKVAPLDSARLQHIRELLMDVCRRMEDTEVPYTIVHGDLNQGNILKTPSGHCQFIDWAEAYVGVPFVSLHHLLLLNKTDEQEVSQRALTRTYRETLRDVCSEKVFEIGLQCMPLLAAASALYGRGNWWASSEGDAPLRQLFARTFAREMDRAAHQLTLEGTLCS